MVGVVMTQSSEIEKKNKEEERISKWRQERQKVAEKEKQQRLKAKKTEREEEEKATAKKLEKEAEKLLPEQDVLDCKQATHMHMITSKRKKNQMSFLLFVILPTLIYGIILKVTVVPLYGAKSILAVTSQNSSESVSVAGVMTGGTDSQKDAFKAYEYIKSKALMDRLEEEMSFITLLSSDYIDPFNRLSDVGWAGKSKQDQMDRFIFVAVDIQTGLLSLEVRTPRKDEAIRVSKLIVNKTSEHLNNLSDDLFLLKVATEEKAVDAARTDLKESKSKLLTLQIESGEQNPLAHIKSVYKQIAELEAQALDLQNKISRAEIAGVRQSTSINLLVKNEAELRERILSYRKQLVYPSSDGSLSLNSLLQNYELAMLDVKISEEILVSSLQSLMLVRRDAAQGRALFQVIVEPATADLPLYPNIIKSVFICFILLFSGFMLINLFRK